MKRKSFIIIAIVFCVVFIDQITKFAALKFLSPFDSHKVISFVNFVLVYNKGAAFGILKGAGNIFFIIISLFAIGFLSWIVVFTGKDYQYYAFLIGGAVGNLTDRIVHGFVVDFIDLSIGNYHWPAFNVADSALTFGITMLVLKSIVNYRK